MTDFRHRVFLLWLKVCEFIYKTNIDFSPDSDFHSIVLIIATRVYSIYIHTTNRLYCYWHENYQND